MELPVYVQINAGSFERWVNGDRFQDDQEKGTDFSGE